VLWLSPCPPLPGGSVFRLCCIICLRLVACAQVANTVWYLRQREGSRDVWEAHDAFTMPCAHSIRAAAPAACFPTHPADSDAQQQTELVVSVHAHVHMPEAATLCGWSEAAVPPAPDASSLQVVAICCGRYMQSHITALREGNAGEAAASHGELIPGLFQVGGSLRVRKLPALFMVLPACLPSKELEMALNSTGSLHAPSSSRLLMLPNMAALTPGDGLPPLLRLLPLRPVQVDVTLLPDKAYSSPCPLRLELWQQSRLLSSSSLLLLPASMRAIADELQRLRWGTEDSSDLADYITDLGNWLHLHGSAGPSQPAVETCGPALYRSAISPWDSGARLMRQAVLWGMPALATLLMDGLMALPSVWPTPFAQLAHAGGSSSHGSCGSAGDGGAGSMRIEDLGGLLHLSLLSPSSSTMLSAVLAWGRRWGGEGFSWRWGERCAAGLTPLDALAASPDTTGLLQLLQEDAAEWPAVQAAHSVCASSFSPSCSDQQGMGSSSSTQQAGSNGAAQRLPLAASRTWQRPHGLTGCATNLCCMLLASLLGRQDLFPCSAAAIETRTCSRTLQHGGSTEAGYRTWAKTHRHPVFRAWCRLIAFLALVSLNRKWVEGSIRKTDLPSDLLVGIPYSVAAIIMQWTPHMAEVRSLPAALQLQTGIVPW